MTVKNETVAVILPTFNRAVWLPVTLASVAAQTRLPDEVWVVDDGSRDETLEILEKIKRDTLPQLSILHTRRMGVSAARNAALQQTKAQFIALLDSDDQWKPQKLEKQLHMMEQNPKAALCHTNEIWIRRGKRVNACKHHEKSGGDIFEACLPRCVISPSASLIRRSVLDDVGFFDERLTVCEDYDLWLRICSKYQVAFIDEPLTIKNGGHADQLSHAYPVMDQFRIQALEKLLGSDHLTADHRQKVRQTIAQKSQIIAKGALKRGNHGMAKTYQEKRLINQNS